MKPSFSYKHGHCPVAIGLRYLGAMLFAMALLTGLPSVTHAQAPAEVVAQVSFTMPSALEPLLEELHPEAQALVGLPVGSPQVSAFGEKVSAHLRKKGYTFATASVASAPGKPEHLKVSVQAGKIGVGNVDGNTWLSSEGILDSVRWEKGETFHYGKFQSDAASLNSNRFVTVDSKLRPRRGDDGEIIVDADFNVDDSVPVAFTANVSNDGARQSSGWRSGVGLVWWEPFAQGDRLALSWLTDPEDPSQMSSYSMQYVGKSSENYDWLAFAGYSTSEYDNIVSSTDLDIAGDGLHLGFAATRMLRKSMGDSLALSFGLTYLNVSNSMTLYGSSYSDESLALLLPRLGLQGTFDDVSGLPGKTFWTVAVLSEAGIADDTDLAAQRPGVSSGFMAGQFGVTSLQPVDLFGEGTGLYLNLAAQLANDPLPVSLQKSIGGSSTVRGYRERETFGDNGFHLNAEFRLPSVKSGLGGSLQPLFFYDYGYVSSEQSLSGSSDSVGMQSFGAGFLGSFKQGLDLGLHVGVPMESTPQSDGNSARAHFDLNFRF